MKFYPVTIRIQEGDIITSKKGIAQKTAITKTNILIKKIKLLKLSGTTLFFKILDKKVMLQEKR